MHYMSPQYVLPEAMDVMDVMELMDVIQEIKK